MVMSKIHNIFIKQHQRGRWRYHWGHVNATVLKVKLSMSIISISSIHLLQTFVNASKIPEKTIMWEVIIHFAFLISAIAMAYTDKILYSTSYKNH